MNGRLGFERMEARRVMSASTGGDGITFDGRVVTVSGTDHADVCVVWGSASAHTIVVRWDGVVKSFARDSVSAVVMNGYGGDDSFFNATALPCTARGGAANDGFVSHCCVSLPPFRGRPEYMTREILIVFDDDASDEMRAATRALIQGECFEVIHTQAMVKMGYPPIERVSIGNGLGVKEAVEAVANRPGVLYAQPNFFLYYPWVELTPGFRGDDECGHHRWIQPPVETTIPVAGELDAELVFLSNAIPAPADHPAMPTDTSVADATAALTLGIVSVAALESAGSLVDQITPSAASIGADVIHFAAATAGEQGDSTDADDALPCRPVPTPDGLVVAVRADDANASDERPVVGLSKPSGMTGTDRGTGSLGEGEDGGVVAARVRAFAALALHESARVG